MMGDYPTTGKEYHQDRCRVPDLTRPSQQRTYREHFESLEQVWATLRDDDPEDYIIELHERIAHLEAFFQKATAPVMSGHDMRMIPIFVHDYVMLLNNQKDET